MKAFFVKIWIRIQYAIIALKVINKVKLMEHVFYQGNTCLLIQGVASPYYDLLPQTDENLKKEKRFVHRQVHVSKFKRKPLYRRFRFSFMSTYNFYMKSWYSSDWRRGNVAYKMSK